ncbi:beta-galactosidase [Tepiditoga spiralis]|uniref:Beta-galactosidase n=1 Tax=Tepiditoga spiralis TaxID=2108365 RepID=A0A7G1G8D2_9BACT|nr:beta-galactosidase BgaS [Tepiditoga spiralis]BBE31666.1 beta-galactosidase [Tepiditoga spiralis]
MNFNKDFLFGASMSGFQFEMGSEKDIDNKSDWYVWTHNAANMNAGFVSGDYPEYGTNYWNQYEEDHILMKELGLKIIRIGIEWSRIFPKNTFDVKAEVKYDNNDIIDINVNDKTLEEMDKIANHDNLNHYIKILKNAKENGLKVMIDYSHFTLPIWIHDCININRNRKGIMGWASKEFVIEFSKYAAYITKKLDEYVDYYATMNEPQIIASGGYLIPSTGFIPAIYSLDVYLEAIKRQSEAHARAYDNAKKYTEKPIGMIYSFSWATPYKKEDEEIIENARYFYNYHFMDTITKGLVDDELTGKQRFRKDLEKRIDFIGVNYYTRTMVRKSEPIFEKEILNFEEMSGYGYDCEKSGFTANHTPSTDMGWEIYPEGLKGNLLLLKDRYNLPMIITENGIADKFDKLRSAFLISHLIKINEAIQDGANIFGYMHWSITDNYEWSSGFEKRFGLIQVDFKTKLRSPRPSYYVYKEIIEKREITEAMKGLTILPYNYLKK